MRRDGSTRRPVTPVRVPGEAVHTVRSHEGMPPRAKRLSRVPGAKRGRRAVCGLLWAPAPFSVGEPLQPNVILSKAKDLPAEPLRMTGWAMPHWRRGSIASASAPGHEVRGYGGRFGVRCGG
jgi:hypothetical protein